MRLECELQEQLNPAKKKKKKKKKERKKDYFLENVWRNWTWTH